MPPAPAGRNQKSRRAPCAAAFVLRNQAMKKPPGKGGLVKMAQAPCGAILHQLFCAN
ncbi:hypothetical protein [Oryzisolibacter sp. LB2S]|uniref:hypothetical protein n=1 Tax=Alicycliphilus soli TaxID=3228789 RepID=UPI003459E5F7